MQGANGDALSLFSGDRDAGTKVTAPIEEAKYHSPESEVTVTSLRTRMKKISSSKRRKLEKVVLLNLYAISFGSPMVRILR